MMFANTMYLRPGNLWKEFRRMKNQSANIGGNFEKKYVDTGEIITGILAQATVNDTAFMGSEPAFADAYACNIRRLQGEKNGSACV